MTTDDEPYDEPYQPPSQRPPWTACKCGAPRSRWRVAQRKGDVGGRYKNTPYRRSAVLCLDCGHQWESDARYVSELPNYAGEHVKPWRRKLR